MDTILDEPALVLVAFVLGALLVVVELALPTLGVAGTTALALGVVGVVGLNRQDIDWWPLLLVGAAVAMWSVMIARRAAPLAQQAAAAGLYASGALTFGFLAGDGPTIVIATAAAVLKPLGFPTVFEAAVKLLDKPAQVGLESLVGAHVTVASWEGDRGTVRAMGSLWNARSGHALSPGAEVVVTGFHGMTLDVMGG